jgi:hypothetical protein
MGTEAAAAPVVFRMLTRRDFLGGWRCIRKLSSEAIDVTLVERESEFLSCDLGVAGARRRSWHAVESASETGHRAGPDGALVASHF